MMINLFTKYIPLNRFIKHHMINWNKYCNHIYFLHLQNSNERSFIETLKNINLYENSILSIEYYDIDKNFNEYKYIKDAKLLDCIIDAYYKNYDNIIIFRDDLLFEDDKIINDILNKYSFDPFVILNPGDICEDALLIRKNIIQYIYHHFFNYNIYKEDKWNENFWNFINNKINKRIIRESICHHVIDYVIPYVNDSDEKWKKKFNEYYSLYNAEPYNQKLRWNNFNNFVYNIRSVAKNIPWINNLFIIVESESQVPDWIIKDNVKIIYHKDFIPKEFLPTYNSCTIESFLYNINELSEYFIYANDDIFILNRLSKNDLFENGKTKNNLINTNTDKKNHYRISNNSFNLINSEFNKEFNLPKRGIHTPHAMIKSHCMHIGVYHKDKIYDSITRFRNDNNLNQYMYIIYEMESNNNISNNFDNIFFDIYNNDNDINMIFEKHNILCLKDSYIYNYDSLNELNNKFKEIFNDKSIYDDYDESRDIIEDNIEEDNNDIKYKIALCAIAKNENRYIREWVEWYKNLGIAKIFLYDNNDIDGEKFEDVINDYIESKFVEVINKRGIIKSVSTDKDGQTLQGLCFQSCYYSNCNDYDWMCFFDIDEYLEIYNTYENLDHFLNDFIEYDGVRVQWRMYGDNNLLYYCNYPIMARFKKDSNAFYDKHLKQIINCNKQFDEELLFCAHGVFNKKCNFVNVKKEPSKNVYMDIKPYDDLPVYLNHFYSKSTEEFFTRKYNKPSAVTGINNKRNFNLDFLKKQYFEYNKLTEEKERFINIFVNSVNSVNVYMASLFKDGFVIKSIKSIINQLPIKSITLSANNYTDEQYEQLVSEINSPKLIVHRTNNEKFSFEKLKFINDDISTKYVAFCDDDLIFYNGFFVKMITECELLDSVVSYHGAILKPLPIEHYYPDRKSFSFNKEVKENKKVDIIGNGVSLFKRDWLSYEEWKNIYDNAPQISMDDITISYALRKNGKNLFVIKHTSGDVIEKKDNNDTVYCIYKKNDSVQTEWVNKYFSKL